MPKVLGQDTQGEVHASFAAHRIARIKFSNIEKGYENKIIHVTLF